MESEYTARIEAERRRQGMPAVETQTEPAMELLEEHRDMLEEKLGQVKNDVAAVLDQVEQEQL